MKKIGLIGGMTPASTRAYYDTLIELGRDRLEGALNNPVVLIYSINLSEIAALQEAGRDDRIVEELAAVAESLRLAGAEIGALTANTPHVFFARISAATTLPLLSIVETTYRRCVDLGVRRALLLGTGKTMKSAMYPTRFASSGIEIVVPDPAEMDFVNRSIYSELSIDLVKEETRQRYLEICRHHIESDGVDAVLLACTEIPLLIGQGDVDAAVVDTCRVHAEAIFDRAEQRSTTARP